MGPEGTHEGVGGELGGSSGEVEGQPREVTKDVMEQMRRQRSGDGPAPRWPRDSVPELSSLHCLHFRTSCFVFVTAIKTG